MSENTNKAAAIVYPLYLEVDPKIAEDLQRRIEEALDHQAEVHAREIRNMALDAYDQAFKAILESVKTAGFCSFCGIVISVHATMAEAQGAMRAHIVACPKMHEELGKLGIELALQPSALHIKCAKCGHPNFNHTKVNGCTEYIKEQCAECGCLEYAGDT